jgi:WD40 repeat protein
MISSFSVPDPIFDLSLSDNKLLTAGPKGCVQLFELDENEIGQRGKGLGHIMEFQVGVESLDKLPLRPPGVVHSSTRIKSVEFSPQENKQYLAIQDRSLFLCDIDSSELMIQKEFSDNVLSTARFNTNIPYMLGAGFESGQVSLLDARISGREGRSGIFWTVENGHTGLVTSVQFNPFIPYWLATAGQDGYARIWDLRFLGSPAACIDAHFDTVSSVILVFD